MRIYELNMRLVWSILVVLTVTGVHSAELRNSVVSSLKNLKAGEIRYAIYRIINSAEVPVVEFTGPRTATYTDFVGDLRRTNPAESRYGVIDYEFIENETPMKKLVLILWSPDTESKDQSLAYASVYNRESAAKFGINHYIVAETVTDLNEETLLSQLKNKSPTVMASKLSEATSEAVGDRL